MLINGLIGLAGQIVGLFGKRGAAKQEALKAVASNMQRTYVDELIVLYWFLPTVLAIAGFPDTLERQQAMIADGSLLFEVQLGISAAVFGLNKIAGKR